MGTDFVKSFEMHRYTPCTSGRSHMYTVCTLVAHWYATCTVGRVLFSQLVYLVDYKRFKLLILHSSCSNFGFFLCVLSLYPRGGGQFLTLANFFSLTTCGWQNNYHQNLAKEI